MYQSSIMDLPLVSGKKIKKYTNVRRLETAENHIVTEIPK